MLNHLAFSENSTIGIVMNLDVLKIPSANLQLLLKLIMMGSQRSNMDNNIKYKLKVLMERNMIKIQLGHVSRNKILKTFFLIVFIGTHLRSFNGRTKNQL